MELTDKIKQIITDKNLTPSIFADEIGVQRPSISHILAGRNKPSLDIVQKIIRRFPDLGLDWILDDHLLPEGISTPAPSKSTNFIKAHTESAPADISKVPLENVTTNAVQKDANGEANRNTQTKARSVDRILIFYSDGSFQEFQPGNWPFAV